VRSVSVPGDADPKIKPILAYWQSRCPMDDRLPARHHLNPVELSELADGILHHVWLLDVERDPLRFRVRLLVGALTAAGGPGAPGQYVDEFDTGGEMTAKLVAMCQDRRPVFKRGAPTLPHAPDAQLLENVALPLANDGVTVDMILGCTVYRQAVQLGPELVAGQ
jgi:hypothetical protein